MKKNIVIAALLAASSAFAGKVSITTLAAGTTMGINILEAPKTYKEFRAAIKRVKAKVTPKPKTPSVPKVTN